MQGSLLLLLLRFKVKGVQQSILNISARWWIPELKVYMVMTFSTSRAFKAFHLISAAKQVLNASCDDVRTLSRLSVLLLLLLYPISDQPHEVI